MCVLSTGKREVSIVFSCSLSLGAPVVGVFLWSRGWHSAIAFDFGTTSSLYTPSAGGGKSSSERMGHPIRLIFRDPSHAYTSMAQCPGLFERQVASDTITEFSL